MRADIIIVTPLTLEFNAILAYLSNVDTVSKIKSRCKLGNFLNKKGYSYTIAVVESSPSIARITEASTEAILLFEPKIAILTGICGGIKDVSISDIVVATEAFGYELGKETDDGFMSRPHVLPFDLELIKLAKEVADEGNWKKRAGYGSQDSKVIFGPIASGDKVITSTNQLLYQYIKERYNNTIAVEMESIGFAWANLGREVKAINIRGVSDLIVDKAEMDIRGNQELVMRYAAGFVFELIYQSDIVQNKSINMTTKELIKTLMKFFIPILKLESVNKIGQEFKEATNTSILEIWEKVRPLFIEEIEELKSDPKNQDILEESTVLMRKKLRVALKDSVALKAELTRLIEKTEKKGTTSENKNFIQNSHIIVKRNFHLGDKN